MEEQHKAIEDLCRAFLLLENEKEVFNFLKDLCTPQEISILSERWKVCRLLEKGNLSYRQISDITGASLTTIGRVSRFLKNETYYGYKVLLERVDKFE